MKVDRSLVGAVLIALVISTLVTLFIVGEKGGPYLLVRNDYRSAEKGRFIIGQTLLAKEPIASLELSYFCLVNRTDLLGAINRSGSPQDVCARIPSLRSYLDISEAGFRAPDMSHFRVQLPTWVDGNRLAKKEFDLYLYDFSKLVWQAVPAELMHSLERPSFGRGHLWDYYNVFACLFDEEGNLSCFYEGVADFYTGKVISIEELTIQRNEEKSVYYGAAEHAETAGNVLSVLDAPERGVVYYEELRRNDRLTILFSIDSSKLPSIDGNWAIPIYRIVHIAAISVDGVEEEFIANMANPPKPAVEV